MLTMKCPRDGSELTKRPYEADVEVDECADCKGMWLEKGELERIQEVVENDYSAELSQIPDRVLQAYRGAREKRPGMTLKCPSCECELDSHEYGYCSQIFVDGCSCCGGVWLDKGELAALEVFFERSKAETRDIRKGFWNSLNDLIFGGIVPD